MKIGVILRTIEKKRGPGIYTQNVMDHLLRLDTKNEYVLFYYDRKSLGRYVRYDHVREKLVKPPLSLTFRELSFADAASRFIWEQVKIPIEANREGVDLIFNPADSVPLFAKCKTVMVFHGSEWLTHPEWFRLFDRIYSRIMMPLYYRKASLFLANSDTNKKDFVTFLGVSDHKIKTIYHGVGQNFRRIGDHAYLRTIREKYRLPEKFLLYVGRIYPGKNFGNVIRAFSKVHVNLPHKLVVTSEPRWGYESEFASIKELGLEDKILFTGWVPEDDLVALYNLAGLFIFPSFYESFGLPLLEAMACGCPAIASQTGAQPEIAGGAAFLVNPHDPDEIADVIKRMLSDENLRRALIEKGFARAKELGWEKCARETLAAFDSLNEV